MNRYYIVGEYLDPQPEDRLSSIDSIVAALAKAKERSECNPKSIIAVWDNFNDLDSIFINGKQFVPYE